MKEKSSRFSKVSLLITENFLKEHCDKPLKFSEIKKKLSKDIHHKNLIAILEYLCKKGKIICGSKGILWIYCSSKKLKREMAKGVEV